MDIPYGLCQCGCGNKTTVSTYTSAQYEAVKGEPRRFLQGHSPRYPRRIDRKTVVIDGVECGLIPLTRGLFATVDMSDYDFLMESSWQATGIMSEHHTRYAYRRATKKDGYTGKDKRIWMHRVIANTQDGELTDHRNRNGLDNRRCNLRVCDQIQNLANATARKNNKNGFKNVTQRPHGKWSARGYENGKRVHVGDYATPEEAARAADAFAIRVHGEFAYLNFPEEHSLLPLT